MTVLTELTQSLTLRTSRLLMSRTGGQKAPKRDQGEDVVGMVTMPLALLFGAALLLMVRKGGWSPAPVAVATAFGLVLASTSVGMELTGWINLAADEFAAWVAGVL